MTSQTDSILQEIAKVLLRCWILGYALLLSLIGVNLFMSVTVFLVHGQMFGLSEHEFQLIMYCAMGLLKIGLLIFFFIPWIAIKLVLYSSAMENDQK